MPERTCTSLVTEKTISPVRYHSSASATVLLPVPFSPSKTALVPCGNSRDSLLRTPLKACNPDAGHTITRLSRLLERLLKLSHACAWGHKRDL